MAHWTFAAGMALLALESIFAGLTADELLPERMVIWQKWRLLAMSFLPGVWLAFSLSYARGNRDEFLVQWRVPLAIASLGLPALAILFRGNLIEPIYPKEPGSPWGLGLGVPGLTLHLFFLLSALLVLFNLERTFQASVGTMRWRIKFMVLGLGLLFAVRAYSSSQVLLFHVAILSLQTVNSIGLLVACPLILRSLLRPGHFEVNVYPSDSLLHNSIIFLLAGLYLLIVGVFAKIVAFLGGDAAFTAKAFVVLVVLVGLAMLVLSERVRLHTARFISRYFQRPLYDYRKVWRSFTEGTISRVEQADLCRAVVKMVSDLFQILSVTVWLVDDEKETLVFGASTSLPETRGGNLKPESADAAEVIRALRNRPEPVDIDSSNEGWSAALRRCTPDEFRKGGNRYCVPMIAAGELLGLMTLGDRVGGVRLSVQEFDLLKCIGNQAAASLRNVRLSERLAQAKEMEAFQAMSAFFVHDLKNTASTLSLMLQNLPLHFHEPAFKDDALRAISKTVDHINDLVGRLGSLRQERAIRLVQSDLNELVAGTLGNLAAADVHLVTNLRPLPKLLLDPEQMHKVLTNLVLNAKEAAGPQGEIRVETSQNNTWAVLSVTDNGCGMSREFVDRSLFRPFQTTKKRGIGIGLFQSRMIVEAHRGKIEVETGLGRGTTFRIFLPSRSRINES